MNGPNWKNLEETEANARNVGRAFGKALHEIDGMWSGTLSDALVEAFKAQTHNQDCDFLCAEMFMSKVAALRMPETLEKLWRLVERLEPWVHVSMGDMDGTVCGGASVGPCGCTYGEVHVQDNHRDRLFVFQFKRGPEYMTDEALDIRAVNTEGDSIDLRYRDGRDSGYVASWTNLLSGIGSRKVPDVIKVWGDFTYALMLVDWCLSEVD